MEWVGLVTSGLQFLSFLGSIFEEEVGGFFKYWLRINWGFVMTGSAYNIIQLP